MFKNYKQWMMLLFVYAITFNIAAQEPVNQPVQMQNYPMQEAIALDQEMAPAPPGPYQVDPDSNSANIYNDMHETVPYNQQPETYGGYVAPRYPATQMSDPYGQGYNQGYNPAPAPYGQRSYGQGYNPAPAPYGQRSYGQGSYPAPAPYGQRPYGQGYNPSSNPAADGYNPQYGETYGNTNPPPYPAYPPYSQPRYGYPYGPQQ
jgi:hypothetical protein